MSSERQRERKREREGEREREGGGVWVRERGRERERENRGRGGDREKMCERETYTVSDHRFECVFKFLFQSVALKDVNDPQVH